MKMNRHGIFWVSLLLVALALPWLLQATSQDYYLGFVRRVMIFALAASSLHFILSYGGMVALGHAAFLGIGAYLYAVYEIWWLALFGVAGLATLIGAISLRTQGVYFIMITLAFAQMIYYLCISLSVWGGEDGLTLTPSNLSEWHFYYLVLGVLLGSLWVLSRLLSTNFGRALKGCRDNEARMAALGYPVSRIKLIAFVIAAIFAGLSGVLLAEHNRFVSPSLMHWTQSATLIVMVLIGGLDKPWAGVWGAVVYLTLQEVLAAYTEYWHLALGIILLGLALLRLTKKKRTYAC